MVSRVISVITKNHKKKQQYHMDDSKIKKFYRRYAREIFYFSDAGFQKLPSERSSAMLGSRKIWV